MEGYHADAFAGLNPNCIVYLDEGVADPQDGKANYVQVRQDATAESGRVYEATGDVKIDPAYDFEAMNAFNITEGHTIGMTLKLGSAEYGDAGWKSLVLPFAPSRVTDTAGNELSRYAGAGAADTDGLYMTASVGSDGTLGLTDEIKPYTPYLAGLYRTKGNADVRFMAGQCEVPQTPEEIRAEGADYALMATLSGRDLTASTTYLLNEEGSSFDAAGDQAAPLAEGDVPAEGRVTLNPFTVYAVSDSGASNFPIAVDVSENIQTGVDGVEDTPAFMITREGGALVIASGVDSDVEVFSVEGLHVKTLRLSRGLNVVEDLNPGVYIICGQKVVM